MSRILLVSAAILPTKAFAHVGPHDFDASGTLRHALSQSDHALALIAALTLPVAVAVLIWKRRK